MKRGACLMISIGVAAGLVGAIAGVSRAGDDAAVSIGRGELPAGYRDWRLVSVAREEGKIDDIRAVLGNDVAIEAYRGSVHPFPDGTIIARLAWACVPSERNNKVFGKAQSFVAGPVKNGVQFMVKDSKKFAATGGWGYFQFDEGKALTDAVMIQGCFNCHQQIADRDFVFTEYAR
ncbi:MAG: cytochrome P460 family protein [Phycisphaerales bacterium]